MNLLTLLTTAIVLQTSAERAPSPSATRVSILVRPQSEVAGTKILLGDIAEVTGVDSALAARISGIEVGSAPLIGLSRSLLKSDIVTRLRFHKIDLSQVEIVSSPTVKVTRTGVELPVPEVAEFALTALKSARKSSDEVSIEPLPLSFRWIVPPGRRELQAGPIRGGLDGGMATVPVTIMVDGRPAKTVEVGFRIKRLAAVLVAVRQIDPHTVLKAEDVSLATQEFNPGVPALTDPLQAIGKRTTRLIAAGAVLTRSTVETAPVISIGAPVEVQVSVGGITVATSGVARSQGAVGERVRVFVSKTNKEVSAVVVDAKTVRLEENG